MYFQRSVIPTVDGGFVFAGILENLHFVNGTYTFVLQSFLIKTDAQGNIQWTKTYDDTGYNILFDLIQTRDSGFAIVGYTADPEIDDSQAQILLIKTAVNGEVGLAMTGSTANTVTLYRGDNDPYWNYVRVRIWVIK